MMADAKFWEFACWTSSMDAQPVIPQHATRYVSKPSKLECFPAEYASTKRTKNGASMGKLYTSSEDFFFVVFARVQPGQAAHICLM
jgi:hypothetical protein